MMVKILGTKNYDGNANGNDDDQVRQVNDDLDDADDSDENDDDDDEYGDDDGESD